MVALSTWLILSAFSAAQGKLNADASNVALTLSNLLTLQKRSILLRLTITKTTP